MIDVTHPTTDGHAAVYVAHAVPHSIDSVQIRTGDVLLAFEFVRLRSGLYVQFWSAGP